VLRCGALLLAAGELPEHMRPEAVVVVGRPTLSRGVRGLMGRAPVYGIGDHPQWTDPQYVASHVRGWLDLDDMSRVDGVDADWLSAWRHADALAVNAVEKLLGEQEWPTGLQLAAEVMDALPSDACLFLGSSNPVRDIDLVAEPRSDLTVYANRGVAGIDGNVSSAVGMALAATGPAYALIGDLTLLHDFNGLLIGPPENRPDLTLIVHNDDGGGIFTLLEQGAAEYKNTFERIFGTPHHADIASLCRGYRVEHVHVTTSAELRAALAPPRGLTVVEVRSDRSLLRDLHARLRNAVAEAALR